MLVYSVVLYFTFEFLYEAKRANLALVLLINVPYVSAACARVACLVCSSMCHHHGGLGFRLRPSLPSARPPCSLH